MTTPHLARRCRSAAVAATGVLSALASVVVLAGPASAATGTVVDGRGDPAGDVTRVTVRWFDGLTVRAAHARPLRDGDLYTAYVDTERSDAGPEYRVFARPNSGVLGLSRILSWNDRGTSVRCRGLRATADTFDDGPVRFFVPGRCLGDPEGSVRVTVRFERDSGRAAGQDWAPSVRRLGPAVARG